MDKKRTLKNLITDVPGVTVGHQTIQRRDIQTGVTAVIPQGGNLFRDKLPAAVHVINGFGKSAGTIQVEELGTLETPILLTNTFGVGTAVNALIRHMLADNPEIGTTTGTVNPVVFECNDGHISDIRQMAVTEEDCCKALESAGIFFEEGAVGAGTGMCCYQLKGGIGSASRLIELGEESYVLGCLVLTNYGSLKNLTIDGYPIGKEIQAFRAGDEKEEQGSVIVILATDLPMSTRQLKRMSKRASAGITRTGAFIGNGSGEIVLSFSTAQRISHFDQTVTRTVQILNENYMDKVFEMTADVVEDAVVSSLVHAKASVSITGEPVPSLMACIEELQTADYSTARERLKQALKEKEAKG